MALSTAINFATGVTVNILTTGGFAFTGELIDQTTGTTDTTTTTDSFLIIRLRTATAPYFAGQVLRINMNQIIALG
ncbi:hypothetical protein Dtox_0886 [Desulfofarcimen acetoxidans DSM 771]|jgi:hypothetical protein|uniref:Uncharacterized protein n=1 Tax=Desulfofarcimen acetoxidans (strain ATCC 49208 / DSM 771 / KCTC 5769 / VKM B-1644 / 5575) TaxID=485916 RepID=C8W2B8_DESAS|nr:hypothetical protein [Desulfofarcimen acetoxidans]ACV61782.1 hypothetical protein Dtox_0886 [Desulfofarcimen acetoxidans DSM 771]